MIGPANVEESSIQKPDRFLQGLLLINLPRFWHHANEQINVHERKKEKRKLASIRNSTYISIVPSVLILPSFSVNQFPGLVNLNK